MNKKKILEVLDYCYRQAHGATFAYIADGADGEDLYEVLTRIEAKIEELSTEDLFVAALALFNMARRYFC